MNKVLLALCCLISTSVYADGPYDGAWDTPSDSYASIYQTGNNLLVLILDESLGGWKPLFGTITGNTALVQSIAGPANLTISVTFASKDLATVTINSCTPAIECDIPTETPFNITRML